MTLKTQSGKLSSSFNSSMMNSIKRSCLKASEYDFVSRTALPIDNGQGFDLMCQFGINGFNPHLSSQCGYPG